MRKIQIAFVALFAAALLASAIPVMAQQKEKKKKVTREEAWSLCAAEVSIIPADQVGQRYARGAACMKRYGYKI